jgi:hypothetical protein
MQQSPCGKYVAISFSLADGDLSFSAITTLLNPDQIRRFPKFRVSATWRSIRALIGESSP